MLLVAVFIVNRFRIRNRFKTKISITWRVIGLIIIFKFTKDLLIVEKGTKSDRVRINTKVIRIKKTILVPLLTVEAIISSSIRSIKRLLKRRKGRFRRDKVSNVIKVYSLREERI